MRTKKNLIESVKQPNSTEKKTPEEKLIALIGHYHSKEKDRDIRDILREIEIPYKMILKICKYKLPLTREETWKMQRAIRYLTVINGWSQFAAQKEILDRPLAEKNEIEYQERRFIQKHKDQTIMGVKISEMQFNEETKLYWVKPGHTRVTEHQVYRALRNKYYERKLNKASKLGDLTSWAGKC